MDADPQASIPSPGSYGDRAFLQADVRQGLV